MYKKYFFIIATLFFSCAYAQDLLHLQVSSGPAIPLGRVASTNVSEPSSGYASTGGMVEFRMGIKPFKYVGFAFNGGLGLLPTQTHSMKNYVDGKTGLNLQPMANPYRFGYASGGLIFGYRVKERWVIDGTVTGGYMWNEMPDVEFSEAGIIYYKSYKTYGGGWMVSAQVSFRFIVYKTFYIGAGLEYIYARPQFKNHVVEERENNQPTTRQNSFTQNMSLIYFSGHLGLTF